jgi:hypothetical protein
MYANDIFYTYAGKYANYTFYTSGQYSHYILYVGESNENLKY